MYVLYILESGTAPAVKYNVCVIVKDSKGNAERKYYNISVRA